MLNVKLRIMKKKNLLTFIFIALFASMSVNVIGQDATVPFSDMTATQDDGTDYVTVNTEMMYFVVPDPVLNNTAEPYDTSETRVINGVNSTFTFEWGGTGTGDANFYVPQADADAPYRVIHFVQEGSLVLNAIETGPGGTTGCPGSTTSLNIEVIAEPSFTVGDGDDVVQTIEICDSDGAAGYDLTIDNISVAYTGTGNVNILGDISVDTDNDADGTFENNIAARTKNDTLYQIDNNAGSPSTTIATGIWMGAQDGDGDTNPNVTRYRYDFGGTVEGTNNNGINDPISRKSDYFENALSQEASIEPGDFQFYAASDANANDMIIDIIVYPTPSTGDIYYVPNDQYNL